MPPMSLSEGSLIAGRYRLDRLLGEGGMGRVWAATHTVTRRGVAIKFLKEGLQHKADVRQRFLREASTASALRHPNVVEVIDVFDLEDHSPVMVMELLDGETLGAKLAREERLSSEETAELMVPVVDAVTAAHTMGIIHRDLKPENIFICRTGAARVKVLDFGIAKLAAEHYLEAGQSVLETEAGAILGTPCYMAPEQLTSSGVDQRADVWSLGVILYECLSGTRPVEGRNMAEVITRLMTGAITPLDRLAPELPHDMTAMVQEMLSRDLKRRPQDLVELTKVLARYDRTRVSAPPSPAGQDARRSSASTFKGERRSVPPASSATMLSAPALGLDTASIDSTDPTSSSPQAAPEKRGSRSTLVYALGAGAVLAVLVLFGFALRPSAPTGVAAKSGEPTAPPLLPASSAVAEPPQAAPATPVLVAPVPPPTAVAAPPPPSADRSSVASGKSSRPTEKTRPGRTAPSNKNDQEGVLFSGRK
jgi:tRNA A-37 threonylcarbamoyl transferase component Bud32